MRTHWRAAPAAILLSAGILACTLGQTPPVPSPVIPTMAPTTAPPPTPDVETVDDFFARCPTAEEVALVDSQLSMSFEYTGPIERLFHQNPDGSLFNEPDPTAGQLMCTAANGSADLTGLQKRAYQSILVMRLLNFSQPLPWTSLQLFDWFVGAIDGIRFRDDIDVSHCCEPANVINVSVSGTPYLAITDRFFDPNFSGGLVYSTILFIHEARHNEGFGHTCPDGASDKTIAEMGAWSVQYYTHIWLAQYSDHVYLSAPGPDPDVYRRALLEEAQYVRTGRFCESPPDPEPTLIP